ncbi:MAG TPA: DNA repair protein RecN [Clostridiales bacterium]|nr:DNA repair protein RecN [Clostridiales bacterium]
MLLNLSISNFAVFENESINFDKGFNGFTGETGSGKSVLIEALSLITGERASKDLIRKGKNSAVIEAVFDTSDHGEIHNILKKLNIEIDPEDYLIVSREILKSGKSISKINGRTVTLSTLKEAGSCLIDIYGQFGHESLFKKENHILLLDSLIQRELAPIAGEYSKLYAEYNKKSDEIDFLKKKLINKETKIEQLQYEIDEIDEAAFKESEEENLLKEIKKLSNIKELQSSLYEANNILNSSDAMNNVYSILNRIKSYDEALGNFLSRLDILLEEIQFFSYDLRDYTEKLEFDEDKLNIIENRMSFINRLKRKYGFTIEKISEYRNESEKELKLLKEAEYNLNLLIKEKEELYKKLKDYSEKISDKRKRAAEILEKSLLHELNDLNMKNIRFKVNIARKNSFSADGIDDVEFLISTNVGSDLNSVQKVVSGGEASRIMLAFKKISSETESTETLVFDEIDSGISGKTAQMAGIKMNYISEKHQVICVTHSPQIASISKNHFLIEKKVVDGTTRSTVKKLDNENKVYEIARLLSGMKITEKSLSNARDLIDSSNIIV